MTSQALCSRSGPRVPNHLTTDIARKLSLLIAITAIAIALICRTAAQLLGSKYPAPEEARLLLEIMVPHRLRRDPTMAALEHQNPAHHP